MSGRNGVARIRLMALAMERQRHRLPVFWRHLKNQSCVPIEKDIL